MSVVPDQSGLALHQMTGAARFADTLTATSALVSAGSAGTVRYRFAADGNLSAPGAQAPFYFGETCVVLDVKHGAGATEQLLNATVRRASVGTISGNPPPAGWFTGLGIRTKLPQFKAVNTCLGNLKRSLSGTHHAFDFAKCARR